MPCNITAGIRISCDALKRVGGLNKRLWLFNMSALTTPIVALTDGFVTDIPLTTYATLYMIEGNKYSHSFEIVEQQSDEGNVQWQHKLMIKIVNTTPTEDAIFEDLSVAEVGAIVQTGNNEFLILGAQNGLTSTESKLQSGQKSGDSSASSITLTGNEQSIYKRFQRTDFNTTLAYLNARTA
jgi:hypothetical protein